MKKIVIMLSFLLVISAVDMMSAGADEGKLITEEGFSFMLPNKWTMPKDLQPKGRRKAKEKIVVLTKDGLPLNKLEFKKMLLSADFAVTKKHLTQGMMPQEMAGVVLNDFELNDNMKNFKLMENKPATIAGIPGFRLVFSYNQDGILRYQCFCYGFKKDDMFYSIWYSAPKRHYFETNLGTAEQIVKSLKLDEPSSGGWSPGSMDQ